jgi:hypothetical protein
LIPRIDYTIFLAHALTQEEAVAKLKLNVEDLRVDSFAVAEEERGEAGTVRGHAATGQLITCNKSCRVTYCDPSMCIDSCWETCDITCGECLSVEVCT